MRSCYLKRTDHRPIRQRDPAVRRRPGQHAAVIRGIVDDQREVARLGRRRRRDRGLARRGPGPEAQLRHDHRLVRRREGVQVLVQLVNRNDLTQGSLVVVKGYLGEIHQIDQAFKAEVRSLSQLLKTSIGNVTTKQCTCERLGNAKCKLTMTGNALNGSPIRASKTVASASGLTVTFGSDAAPTGHYSNGLLKFTSGANSGVTREIKSHTNSSGSAVLNLRTAFPFDISPGDVATLEAG